MEVVELQGGVKTLVHCMMIVLMQHHQHVGEVLKAEGHTCAILYMYASLVEGVEAAMIRRVWGSMLGSIWMMGALCLGFSLKLGVLSLKH